VARIRATTAVPHEFFEALEANLAKMVKKIDDMSPETKDALRSAEFLYMNGDQLEKSVDFSRSIGFSYCFAVENEAKSRLRKRLQKFFADPATPRIVNSLMEENRRSVSLFFHQHLLRIQREIPMGITIDNVYLTFQRILEHGGKYKPDGLKALGIILICFGRAYTFRKFDKPVQMDNPLGIRGLTADMDVLNLAALLINLQHYRNPYIHPEISEMEKLSKIRQTSFDCMNYINQLV
jgi:hypothetical protein